MTASSSKQPTTRCAVRAKSGVIVTNQLSCLPTITEPDTLRSMLNNSAYVLPLVAAAILRVRWRIAATFVGGIGWLIWLLTVAIQASSSS